MTSLSNHILQEKLNQDVLYESSFSTGHNTAGTNNSSWQSISENSVIFLFSQPIHLKEKASNKGN